MINLSLEFPPDVTASDIPGIVSAIHFAHDHGVVVVGASGNESDSQIAYPARDSDAISVGATTLDRCLADYSNGGARLDLVAPGGGNDADAPGRRGLPPRPQPARHLPDDVRRPEQPGRFSFPGGWYGTSMAAPQVAAAAAMVIASGVIGRAPDARRRSSRGSSRPPSRWGGPGRTTTTATGCSTSARRRPARVPLANAGDSSSPGAHVVLTIRTEHGAWWETLFGTDPSRKRLAPVIPLLPTTIRSSRVLLGDVEDRVRGVALTRVRLNLGDAGAPRLRRGPVEQLEHVRARVHGPLDVARHLRALQQQPLLVRGRLVRADDLELRLQVEREADRVPDGRRRGIRAVGSDEDRSEHRVDRRPPLRRVS